MKSDYGGFYQQHVFFCTNERAVGHTRGSCARKNSSALRDYMKQQVKQKNLDRVRINAAGCLDRCELGPTLVIYPAGIWYRCADTNDVDAIIQQHLIDGQVVDNLLLKNDQVSVP